MEKFVLRRLGLINPTELERQYNGKATSFCVTQGLNIEQTVKRWKEKFCGFGETKEFQIVYASPNLINSMSQRNSTGCKSVIEIFKEYGVIFKEYILTNREWLESFNDKRFASVITHPTLFDGLREAIHNAANEYECDENIEEWLKREREEE